MPSLRAIALARSISKPVGLITFDPRSVPTWKPTAGGSSPTVRAPECIVGGSAEPVDVPPPEPPPDEVVVLLEDEPPPHPAAASRRASASEAITARFTEGSSRGVRQEPEGIYPESASDTSPWKCAISCLAALEQPALGERARADAALDALDEHLVLAADLAVELEQLLDPRLVLAGGEEVVEEARRPGRRDRVDRPDREVRPAREDVHGRARPEEVELAARKLALGVVFLGVRIADRRALGRDEAVGLEPVGVEGDVDRLRQARVRDRAVVALEEVLADDLPVRLDLGLGAEAVLEPVDVEPELGDLLRHRAESLLERRRVGVGVHEHERPPGADGGRAAGRAPRPRTRARGWRAAPRGACRRGRTSRRGRGTGASRAAPRPARP